MSTYSLSLTGERTWTAVGRPVTFAAVVFIGDFFSYWRHRLEHTRWLVRHYYGEFIHADVPWMYGPFRHVFVSPVMHRWHHARDVTGTGSSFATVFSVFDRAFGTHYVPGLCNVPLGVSDDVGSGLTRQLLYPFVAWTKICGRFLSRT